MLMATRYLFIWKHSAGMNIFERYCPDYQNLQEMEDHYARGGLGDVKVKKFLNNVMQEELEPIRKRRKEFERIFLKFTGS